MNQSRAEVHFGSLSERVSRMETGIPRTDPSAEPPTSPGAGHQVCLHNVVLDSESSYVLFSVSLWIKRNSIRVPWLLLVQTGWFPRLPGTPPSGSREAPADKRVAYIRRPLTWDNQVLVTGFYHFQPQRTYTSLPSAKW